jgi:hypothetical protein
MNKEKVVTVAIIFSILLIAGIIIYSKTKGPENNAIPSIQVSEYIGARSILYVQTGCSHCIEQEALFGENAKYLNMIDCVQYAQVCIKAGIEATPTWVINGKKYVGVQSIEKLKELTNYTG